MNKQDLVKMASEFIENSEYNYVSAEIALSESVAGMKIYDAPIFGFAAADDPYFQKMKDPAVIGGHYMLPNEWLPDARTVISFFLPYTGLVKKGNARDFSWPSDEWLHGRVEGSVTVNRLCTLLHQELIKAGFESIIPSMDERFSRNSPHSKFTSNWSERHAAFISGLGTFGLSKGIITSKGMAGRFGSIITTLELTPDKRAYEDIYEYCINCGACVKHCPAHAITIEKGKDHQLCSDFLDITREKHEPRYGCGKCQVKVPCESGIPKQQKAV